MAKNLLICHVAFPANIQEYRLLANSRLKSVGARTHPCLTPFVTGKGSDTSPFSITPAIIPKRKDRTALTNFEGIPVWTGWTKGLVF